MRLTRGALAAAPGWGQAALALAAVLALVGAAALWLWSSGHSAAIMDWAVAEQRAAQQELARLVAAARRGETGVVWALVAASGLYGFVHALGPGHGKVLIGGAGLSTRAEARSLAALAVVSALAQGLTAVLLVYGGLGLLSVGAGWALGTTERVLIPLGHAAIAAVGAVLAWRGLSGLRPRPAPAGTCGCGHRHGPTAAEVARLSGWRDATALVAAIAVRPCSGAVMVLVIAWQTGLHGLGLAAVGAMALGTGAFTALVALGSVGLRDSTLALSGRGAARARLVAPVLQLVGGGLVLALGLGLLSASLG